MTTTYGPPTWVDGPLPVPRTSRLIDVANTIDDLDPHWRAGAQIYSYPPDLPHTWNPCPPGTIDPGEKVEGGVIPIPIFDAFQVYVSETCTARGLPVAAGVKDQDAFVARATATFTATESHGVELALVNGVDLDSPYLTDADVDILNGGAAASPTVALALLEEAIGATARGGVVHATPGTATAWESTGFTFDRVGGYGLGSKVILRSTGTPIAVGTGYIGSQPEGGAAPTATKAWAYATGPLTVRRGTLDIVPGTLKEALDRSDNTITYRAERDYLIDWDTVLQAAVLVDWTL